MSTDFKEPSRIGCWLASSYIWRDGIMSNTNQTSTEQVAGGFVVIGILLVANYTGCDKSVYQWLNPPKTTATPHTKSIATVAPTQSKPLVVIDKPKSTTIIESPTSTAIKSLLVSGADGTLDLQILASNMSPEEAFLLGLGVLLTGADTYAVRFRFENTGTVPIRININRIRVHFGNESVGVSTIDHPAFLSNGLLLPGNATEGLAMYKARIDIGAAMRFGLGGKISYSDKDVDVSYR